MNRIPVCKHTNFQLAKINVVAGFPVFLFPRLFRSRDEFFFCSTKLLDISWSDSHEATMF